MLLSSLWRGAVLAIALAYVAQLVLWAQPWGDDVRLKWRTVASVFTLFSAVIQLRHVNFGRTYVGAVNATSTKHNETHSDRTFLNNNDP